MREALLRAAAASLLEDGPEGLSFRAVAKRAGVTPAIVPDGATSPKYAPETTFQSQAARGRAPRFTSKGNRMSSNGQQPTIVLDGEKVSFSPGETIYEVAERHGKDIPTLCYDPRVSSAGSCRLCMVEVEGQDEGKQ